MAELPSQNICSRGRQELASLKQLAALYPCPNAPLGYATMGLKTLKPRLKTKKNLLACHLD